ncbi:MAG: peptidoglycan-associated lipoprotein Pal [Rhodocyclaceae bacterium]|nr:peptidoglycan-associated lipoprotein Pal [Rhodocyclaceae bacterium]
MNSPFRHIPLRALAGMFAVATLVAGCSTPGGPEQTAANVVDRSPGKPVVATPTIAPITTGELSGSVLATLTDPKSVLSKRSIYFDYDQYVIKDEFKPLVDAHAKFLASHADYKMLIQGNADERGSREYNLALGQKRADALKQALKLLGVRETQLESVSLGKEKPKNEGHDEAAWAENRRDDMLYRDATKPAGEF